MNPVLLMAAPNGARRGKGLHPALPITIAETAAEAARCHAAGAAALHLHIRDDAGRHSLDAGRYREAMAAVAEAAPGMAIQITTESAGLFGWDVQSACLNALAPEAASVALRDSLAAPEREARALYHRAHEQGIGIQHILFAPGEGRGLRDAVARGLIPGTRHAVILVLGGYDPPRDGSAAEISPFLAALEGLEIDWMICCFGPEEPRAALAAMRAGGHARLGFENNIHLAGGRVAPNSAALIAEAAAAAHGRRAATPAEARTALGIYRETRP